MCRKCGSHKPKCDCSFENDCDQGPLWEIPTSTVFYTGPSTNFLLIPTGLNLELFVQTVDLVVSNLQNQIDELKAQLEALQ